MTKHMSAHPLTSLMIRTVAKSANSLFLWLVLSSKFITFSTTSLAFYWKTVLGYLVIDCLVADKFHLAKSVEIKCTGHDTQGPSSQLAKQTCQPS